MDPNTRTEVSLPSNNEVSFSSPMEIMGNLATVSLRNIRNNTTMQISGDERYDMIERCLDDMNKPFDLEEFNKFMSRINKVNYSDFARCKSTFVKTLLIKLKLAMKPHGLKYPKIYSLIVRMLDYDDFLTTTAHYSNELAKDTISDEQRDCIVIYFETISAIELKIEMDEEEINKIRGRIKKERLTSSVSGYVTNGMSMLGSAVSGIDLASLTGTMVRIYCNNGNIPMNGMAEAFIRTINGNQQHALH